jgi:hypothetical protein
LKSENFRFFWQKSRKNRFFFLRKLLNFAKFSPVAPLPRKNIEKSPLSSAVFYPSPAGTFPVPGLVVPGRGGCIDFTEFCDELQYQLVFSWIHTVFLCSTACICFICSAGIPAEPKSS